MTPTDYLRAGAALAAPELLVPGRLRRRGPASRDSQPARLSPPPMRSMRCECCVCGAHLIAMVGTTIGGNCGNCGNCGSYEVRPLEPA